MREGDTPLIDAARRDRAAKVATLLADGAGVDEPKTDGSGKTALFAACKRGHIEVVTILIDAGANVNQGKNDGRTPLYVACEKGLTEIVAKLIAANADVNKADNTGVTPLLIACQKGHTKVVTTLIAANASVSHVSNRGAGAPRHEAAVAFDVATDKHGHEADPQ
jgi:ankyrin repeat protein